MLTITITISTDFRPLVIIVILFRHALVHTLYQDKKQKLAVQFVSLEATSDAMNWAKKLQPPFRTISGLPCQ